MVIQEKLRFLQENTVISWHEHVWFSKDGRSLDVARNEATVATMDLLGVDKSVISRPMGNIRHCSPEQFITANNAVAEAIKMYPGRQYGMAFVNPGFRKEALEELDRCVNEYGFVGVKLYHHYFMDNPVQYPLIEKCIDLDIPILIHAGHVMDPATRARQPRISDGVHMANVAKRYPEATFVMGHIGGGGDWQWSVKAIADTPNVYADIGGSVFDRSMIEESVKLLGANRLLFATDGVWECGVGKVLGADIPLKDKKTILEGSDFLRYLNR